MATQNRTTLVIDANTQGAQEGVKRLATDMQGAKRQATDLATEFNRLNLAISGGSSAFGALRNLLGSLGFGLAIHDIANYMDAWMNLNARLKLVTSSFQEFKTAQQGVFDIAQSTRQGLKETADLYYKVTDAVKGFGKTQQDVLQHVKAVNQAIIISGSSPESSKAALTQYIQSIQGVMQGDEARSLREQAPRLFRAIRENIEFETGKFGVSQMKFKQMLSDGLVDTKKLFDAMERAAPQLNKEFELLPLTIGQAWTMLENQMLKFIGSQGESTGMFTAVANGVKLLADNIGNLVNVLGVGVASWAAYKAMVFLNIEGMVSAGKANETRLAGIATTTAAIETSTAAELNSARIRMTLIERNTAAIAFQMNAEKALHLARLEYNAISATIYNPRATFDPTAWIAAREKLNLLTQVTHEATVATRTNAVSMTERMAATNTLNMATLAHTTAMQANTVAQAEAAFAASYTGKAFGFLKAIVIGVKDEVLILTAVMMRNPWIAAATALAALATAAYAYRDSLIELQGEHVTLGSAIKASWETITEPSKNWFNSMGNYIDELLKKFEPLTEKIKSLIPNSVSTINNGFGLVSDFMMNGGLLKMAFPDIGKRAAANDTLIKLQADQKAALDKNEKDAYKTSKATDLFEGLKGDAGGLNNAENHQKKIAEIYMKEIRINQIYTEEIKANNAVLIQAKKDHNVENEKIAQQAIDDAQKNLIATKSLADQLIQKENDALAQLNKKDTGNNALEKEIAAKRALMKEYQSLMIDELAMKHGVPPNLVKATATIESSWNPDAISPVGARGLLQVMPANFQHLGITPEDVKNEKVMTDKSIAFLKENWIAAGKDIEKFWVLWNQGHLNKDKETGAFSMSLQADETQKGLPKLKEAYKQVGGELSALTDLEHAHTKALTEQEQAAKKIADSKQRIYESTAIGKYLTDMKELDTLYGNDKRSNTYQENAVKIADTFLKSTVDLNAYNQSLKENERLFEQTARGKFEKTDAQLRASRSGMSENEYLNKQKEMVDAYLKDTGFEVKKDNSEQITKAYENEVEALEKIRREINLNDAASYEAAQRQKGFSDTQIENLLKLRKEVQLTKLQDDIGLSMRGIASSFGTMFSNVLTKGMSFTTALRDMFKNTMSKISDGLMNFGMTSMMSGNFLAGFAAMAGSVVSGLLQSVFKGKVTDLTTPETVLSGSVLGSASSSNSIKNIVDTLNSIHATEYRELASLNDNFKNLVESTTKGTALALRDMGGVKYSMKGMNGQSSNTGASEKQFLMGLGTTAISAGAAAIGVGTSAVTSALAGAIGVMSGVSTGVTGALVGLSASIMSGGLAAAAAMGGIGLLIGGAIYGLSKLLGIGKVKFEAVGGGLITNAQQFMIKGMEEKTQLMQVSNYSKIKKTVTGWFSDDVTYFDVINGVNNPMTKLFTGFFGKVKDTILQSTDIFGEDLLNTDITLAKAKLSLKKGDKYAEENQKKISDYLNKASDDIAMQAFGRTMADFQKLGEGMYETITRLATQSVVAKSGFEKLGMTVKLSGLGLVSFSDSLANAMGGLKEMQAAFDDIYNSFTSEEQKLIDAKKATQAFLDSLKIPAEKGVTKSITTDNQALEVLNYLKGSLESVSTVLGEFKSATNVKPENDITKTLKDFAGYFSGATKDTLLGLGKNITTESLKAALVGSGKSLNGEIEGTKAINSQMWQGLIDYAKANSEFAMSEKQFDKARWNLPLVKLLDDLGFTLPDTIDGVQKFVDDMQKSSDAISGNINQFHALKSSIKMVTAENQKFIDGLKKAIPEFKESIEKWVLNKQITQLGTPETQFKIAQDEFNKTLGILRDSSSTPEQLTQAMSDITGSADAYISKIEQMYARGETGANLIEGVVNSVKNLPKTVSLQQQTVDLLTKIRDGVYEIPSGMELLFDRFGIAKAEYEKNPTGKNQLTFDAYTKMILTLDNAYKNGADSAVMNRIVESISSGKGLEAAIKVVIDQSNISNLEKGGLINNLISGLDDTILSISKIQLDFSGKELQDRLDLIVASFGQLTSNVYTIFEIDVPLKNVNDAISAANTLIDAQNVIGSTISNVKINIKDVHLAVLKTQELIANQFESLSIAGLVKIDYTQVYESILRMGELVSWQNTSTSIDGKVSVNNQDVFNANVSLIDLVSKQTQSMAINGAINIDSSQINSAISSMRELLALQKSGTATPPPVAPEIPVVPPPVVPEIPVVPIVPIVPPTLSPIQEFLTPYLDAIKRPTADDIRAITTATDAERYGIQIAKNITQFYELITGGADKVFYKNDVFMNGGVMSGALLTELNGVAVPRAYRNLDIRPFANGGAFTNGIVSNPTMFNMGLMGEAGSEAIMPLTNINGSLGVRAVAANDSNVDTTELVAELKENNKNQATQIRLLTALLEISQASLKESKEQTDVAQTTAAKIRIGARQ
jgi:tape measure domain-containing protein